MNKKRNIPWHWILPHVPALLMIGALIYDYRYYKAMTSYSGYFAVFFLTLTLALNPLRKLFPTWIWVAKLNRSRRQLGVASFSYALIHLSCYVIKRILAGFWETIQYFAHPTIIPGLWIAFPILLVLAITSNQISIKKLGFPCWKKLHRTVYVAQAAAALHMALVGEIKLMLMIFSPLYVLQYLGRRKTRKEQKHQG